MNTSNTTLPELADLKRQGVVVALKDGNMRWLVVRRAAGVARAPGKVGFPGGEVEQGESQEQAVVREVREELDIVARPVRKFWEASDQVPGFVLHGWLAEWDGDAGAIKPDPAEVADVLWLTPREIVEHPDGFPGNRSYVDALLAAVSG